MDRNKKDIVGLVGQYGSMCLLVAGVIIEICLKAHIGFIFLTTGGLLWGVSTKIRGK